MKSNPGRKLPFRPTQTLWFETYTPRHQTVYAIDALSRTGLIELEGSADHAAPLYIGKIKESVREFDKLYTKYARYLPAADQFPATMIVAPEEEAENALTLIREFADNLDSSQKQLAEQDQQLKNLYLLNEYLGSLSTATNKLARVSHTTDFLYKGLFACPKSGMGEIPQTTINAVSQGVAHDFYTVAGLPDQTTDIDRFFLGSGCTRIDVPEWLPDEAAQQQDQVTKAIKALEVSTSSQDDDLYASKSDPELGIAAANITMLKWYADKPGIEDVSPRLCHITGWARTDDIALLQDELEKKNIDAIIRFTQPPADVEAPVSMLQTWWSKPFHLFIRMMGTPGSTEIDPSFILPVIVPLLFGYMFPDVGHGILLAVIGLVFYKRWPTIRFLIPCGIVASLFGVLFGEVFGMHDIIPTLWVQPLEHPIKVLIAPMIFGIFLMLLGLILNGVEAYWRGEFHTWLLADAAIIIFYTSAVLIILHSAFVWPVILALVWYLLGNLILSTGNRFASLLKAMGNLAISTMELGLNTFSFLRVGAFALAHAALTSGILEIASNIEDDVTRIIILIVLHSLLIIAEGFIVFIQTVRLVLFEFFIRFLHAEGRIFRSSEQVPAKPGK